MVGMLTVGAAAAATADGPGADVVAGEVAATGS